jgi:hypothetical protein
VKAWLEETWASPAANPIVRVNDFSSEIFDRDFPASRTLLREFMCHLSAVAKCGIKLSFNCGDMNQGKPLNNSGEAAASPEP